MYTGPGSGPMLATATAWEALAAELRSAAAGYSSTVSELGPRWRGSSSTAMAAAAQSFTVWLSDTAAQAEQTAAQAKLAAAAYETAFAATVPPTVVAANRTLLMALIATNFLGQNSAAIAATEAAYVEMWAQDAAAMLGYTGASASATQLTPFSSPPNTSNPGGAAGQTAAVANANAAASPALTSSVSQAASQPLAGVASPAATATGLSFTPAEIFETLASSFLNLTIGPFTPTKLYDPLGAFYDLAIQCFLAPFNNFNMQTAYAQALGQQGLIAGAATSPAAQAIRMSAAVSAATGQADLVGHLSVPQGWTAAAPAIRTVAAALPGTGLDGAPAAAAAESQGGLLSDMALSGLLGRSVAGPAGTTAHPISPGFGVVPGASATTATIIVIPED
ncbi:PPE family protein [Mycobacterium vicinigordonae]|uniref:PPE family protein n=1 Tax=Mycobacterium vicinigordonae TaxID=1719132 RepID=A0A7D6E679_9MYCO|nr:PPE family protein [Mycobacterium vicinigordonae]